MAPKNRKSGKRKTQRHGLSGNPQRRAEQLERERPAPAARHDDLDPPSGSGLGSFRDLAYQLAGGADEAPWWRDSHESVLKQARALDWPSKLSDIEDRTCDLVGGQFYDNLEAHEAGHHQVQWLRALAERAGAALREAIADGRDWEPLWALLYGVALTTPAPGAEAEDEAALRAKFPEIKDPYETALAELEKASSLLSSPERFVVPHPSLPLASARPVGVPLVARDAYGSRFLVVAPFGYEADAPDHWYAWDVDACWILSVVAAGTYGSADEALDEWRTAVGTAADSELLPGDPGLVAKLLDPCLQTGPFANLLQGNEPRALVREVYRMRRRARVLAEASFGTADGTPDELADGAPASADKAAGDVEQFGRPAAADAHKAFRAWYRERHPGAPKGISAAAETIMAEWGAGRPVDERSFFACSPNLTSVSSRPCTMWR